MAAVVGFSGRGVTDDSYGGILWFLWFLWLGLAWLSDLVGLRMAAEVGFPGLEVTDGSYGGSYGCPGRLSRPRSYGWFLWMVPMVPMVV